MNVIYEFLNKPPEKAVYLFDMDSVLNIQNKNSTAIEKELWIRAIKMLRVRKHRKIGFIQAGTVLNYDKEMIKSIIENFSKVKRLNKFIISALDSAKKGGHRLYVATNNCPELTENFLDSYGIKFYFQDIFCPEKLNWTWKGDPNYFKLISKKISRDVSDMILVDDSKKNCDSIESIGGRSIHYQYERNIKL